MRVRLIFWLAFLVGGPYSGQAQIQRENSLFLKLGVACDKKTHVLTLTAVQTPPTAPTMYCRCHRVPELLQAFVQVLRCNSAILGSSET